MSTTIEKARIYGNKGLVIDWESAELMDGLVISGCLVTPEKPTRWQIIKWRWHHLWRQP